MISAPSDMRCRSMPDAVHEDEDDRQHQRHGERDDDAGAKAERQEAHGEHDDQRLEEGAGEFADRLLDDLRLIGDLVDLYADRRLGADLLDRRADVFAEFEDIAALGHHAPTMTAG